ncbi:carbon-nitrogen family hydrolase [Wenjunlia tyrosinilytica]|uniref:Hydrolase n=1 Tax=Wenjunlia tyrosinilytica TaxID=1544741 RepID=A0A918DV51_9ACTN|nr:carbon-nitrogen family hydrolase [Wenjunlia tyrosinilytica]GGO84620.1 hydrolase [Wenjunlia tyrosinilytica]
MRAALMQIDVHPDESVDSRRSRVADLVRAQSGADLVVLPELWPTGAFAYDLWEDTAEPLDGPTATAMSGAARDAGVWLHAGSIVEREATGPGSAEGPGRPGRMFNTSLVFGPDGELRRTYRKIHRFGFDEGEAVVMGGGEQIATAATAHGTLGLATCYDLRFPEQFRLLVDAGAELLVIPAGWPARRREHWLLLARARAVESQAFVLACCSAGTHAGVEQAGHSLVVDPWGEVLAEGGTDEEVLVVDIDPGQVAKVRADFPVLRDRLLGLPVPPRR